MPDSTQPAPGFYWLHDGASWEPAQWTGKEWWGISMTRPYEADEIKHIGPQLVPPAEPEIRT